MDRNLELIPKSTFDLYTRVRADETKLGQTLKRLNSLENITEQIEQSKAQFVVVGIPEDIGPRANFGNPGTDKMFLNTLSYLCNIQDNEYLHGKQILILGQIKTSDLMLQASKHTNASEQGRAALFKIIETLDKRVSKVLSLLFKTNKQIIIIGGGHNNVYPICEAYYSTTQKKLGILNVDPHADLRPRNGRHNGNGVSYAIDANYVERYFVLGMHESYNNTYIINKLKSSPNKLGFISLEKMLFEDLGLKRCVQKASKFLAPLPVGFELDLDAVSGVETSTKTPIGLPEFKVRTLIREVVARNNVQYFHICEGIPSETGLTGKLISYFITDFIKATERKYE